MGRYFHLLNATKNHCVSSFWKGSPPVIQEVLKIAELLKWNLSIDTIRSYSDFDSYALMSSKQQGYLWIDEYKYRDLIYDINETAYSPKKESAKFIWDGNKMTQL